MEHKVDEILEHKIKIQVVENKYCYGCYFLSDLECTKPDSFGSCLPENRKDNKSIIFKEIQECTKN